MFYTITVAISQIGNNDEIGKFSAHYIPDGNMKMSILGGPAATISVKDHHMVTVKKAPEKYRAVMEFGSMELAHDLFDGKVNAVVCVGQGKVRISGMISQVDNVNRILDRVALYLA